MRTSPIPEIAARFLREASETGRENCPIMLRRCVAEIARAIALDAYLDAHVLVAATPREDLPEIKRDLETRAVALGCRFATLLRDPDAPANLAWTELQLLGAREYWNAFRRLDETFSMTAGSA